MAQDGRCTHPALDVGLFVLLVATIDKTANFWTNVYHQLSGLLTLSCVVYHGQIGLLGPAGCSLVICEWMFTFCKAGKVALILFLLQSTDDDRATVSVDASVHTRVRPRGVVQSDHLPVNRISTHRA